MIGLRFLRAATEAQCGALHKPCETHVPIDSELNAPHDAGKAAMQQIAEWLEKLGMSEYAQRFAENRIDFSVLPDLTDQHLKDLGIALGDRLKMLRAICELSIASRHRHNWNRNRKTPLSAARLR